MSANHGIVVSESPDCILSGFRSLRIIFGWFPMIMNIFEWFPKISLLIKIDQKKSRIFFAIFAFACVFGAIS